MKVATILILLIFLALICTALSKRRYTSKRKTRRKGNQNSPLPKKKCKFNHKKICKGRRPGINKNCNKNKILQPSNKICRKLIGRKEEETRLVLLKSRSVDGEPLGCGAWTTLSPGKSFTIQSPGYPNLYPPNKICKLWFEVDKTCSQPQVVCDRFDVRGWKRRKSPHCQGDKLKVYTETKRNPKELCGSNRQEFSEKGTSWFDITFKSNKRNQGTGYSCTVSCKEDQVFQTPASFHGASSPKCQGTCGRPNKWLRIVGGTDIEENEYPWQVGLVYPGERHPKCGGSLISSRTVLSAAHCKYILPLEVLLGEHDTQDDSDGQIRIEVEKIINHHNHDPRTENNDFALLILKHDVTFSRNIMPVCLPQTSTENYENLKATVTGWGRMFFGGPTSTKLLKVDVRTYTNEFCKHDTEYKPEQITDNMICASNAGKDACQGDSGGPLVTSTSTEKGVYYTQIGVVSWGAGCAVARAPGVYSRVSKQLDWIKNNMEGITCPILN